MYTLTTYHYVFSFVQILKEMEEHLWKPRVERSVYRSWCYSATEKLQHKFTSTSGFSPTLSGSSLPRCSLLNIAVHYVFDMAQQIHYLSNPVQPGLYYFLTPQKCGIFGVCNEGIPQQVNYLIDKAVAIGKWTNIIISMLHQIFASHSLGESKVHLHANNCCGQNKNNDMIE